MYCHMPAKSYQYFTATVLVIWHVLANVSASRTSRRTSQFPQHNVPQHVLQMYLTISRSDWGARPKFYWFQSSFTKPPTPICSLQRIPLPLLDLMAVVLRCCILWWHDLFSGRDQLLEEFLYLGVKVVTLLSFQYDGHDLLASGNDQVFRQLHTSGHFSLFTECLIRFYKFQSSCFPDHQLCT